MTTPTREVVISYAETIIEQADFTVIESLYQPQQIIDILGTVLDELDASQAQITIPSEIGNFVFQKNCELEIYITDPLEGRDINLDARGKDYATNILSYPSDLPESVIEMLPTLPLGELVICHEVVAQQAREQGKTLEHHLTHLLVHGILHLLGFDHELGQTEQDEMEALEIAILSKLGITNPYE